MPVMDHSSPQARAAAASAGAESLGTTLRRAREARGIDPAVLAIVLGIAPQHLVAIEQGRIHPSARELEAFARRLGIDPGALRGLPARG